MKNLLQWKGYASNLSLVITSLTIVYEFQILEVQTENLFYRCSSHPWIRDFIQVSIYSCLGVLQVCALYFAFQIRKVKVKGLNDAKYTAITVYFTTIAMILTVITTFTLSTYITAYAIIYGFCIWAIPTIVLGVLFIPKVPYSS